MARESVDVSVRIISIGPLGRLLCVIGVGAVMLLQPAVALAAPSPSPKLEGILLSPPGTDFVEADNTTPGIFEGPFDAAGYADITSTNDAKQAETTLDHDGFLSGFGRTWFSSKSKHIYVEAVMAFTGAKGAKAWLSQSELADKAEVTYQHPITIAGIESYYGARLADTANHVYADAYVFVKGNDTFLVSTVSTKDDLATTAATQAKLQFDSAPPYTVPPSQWPESRVANVALDAAKVFGAGVAGILVLAVIVTAFLVMRSRRRPMMLQAASVLGPSGGAAAAPVPAVQMSDDRRSWWDGANWKDAEHEVPPAAQRSDDGKFWWDGQTWRAIPAAPPS